MNVFCFYIVDVFIFIKYVFYEYFCLFLRIQSIDRME